MSKIGVGVGDDFPVDDENGGAAAGPQGAQRSEQEEFEEWKRRRDAHRAERERWHAQKEEWRARKRAFKQKVRQAAHESFGGDYDRWRHEGYGRGHRHGFGHGNWGWWMLIPLLAVLVFFSLLSAIFKAPFLILGIVAVAAIVFSHRRHHWHGGWDDYGYDRGPFPRGPRGPIVTPPPAQNPPAPPPAVTNGN